METVNRPRDDAPSGRGRDDGRVAWVDAAKGMAIVLVVTMHATLGVGEAMGGEGFMHAVVEASKPFRMPALFLVSGLFLSRVIERDWRGYADKRIVHFAYFYGLWLLIQSGFKAAQVGGGTVAGFAEHLAISLVQPFSTLWFIYLLAILSALTKLVRRWPAALLLVGSAALQIAPVATGITVVDETCERWVYFLSGYLLASRIFAVASWAGARPLVALAALAAWGVANGALALTPFGYGSASALSDLPVISLAAGLAGAIAVVVAASLLTRAGLAAPLRYCGAHAIGIYLAFFLPMAATRAVLVRTGVIADVGIVSALVTASAVLVPLALEWLSRGTRFSFLFERPAWARLPSARPARDGGLAAREEPGPTGAGECGPVGDEARDLGREFPGRTAAPAAAQMGVDPDTLPERVRPAA